MAVIVYLYWTKFSNQLSGSTTKIGGSHVFASVGVGFEVCIGSSCAMPHPKLHPIWGSVGVFQPEPALHELILPT